jgi:hypothetical protein
MTQIDAQIASVDADSVKSQILIKVLIMTKFQFCAQQCSKRPSEGYTKVEIVQKSSETY